MTSQTERQTPAPPSLSTLAKTTVVALVAATAILVTIVLPAEYAIDPVGTGRWLGLTDIASPPLAPVEAVSPTGAVLAPVQNGPVGEYPAEFKLDVFEITLQPYEYVEYKYHLEQGATMLYLCLPRTRFFLQTLILWSSADRVLVDAIRTRCVAADPPNVTPCSVDPAA